MSTDGLSPPGSSTYDSNTMFIGDGTWNSDRNSFLLPNLQGLNFATMQYNGMGNRFRDLSQYHVLITGHGVVAAITFIGILPAAILIARFYHSGGRAAYKAHVYLQILTVFLSTVVLALGWFAVGPKRSLTNPHHGIGVAIYVCVLVQFLYGWWMSRRERKRSRPHPTIPLKVHIHRLFGRGVAVLAFVQIALGMTLYGCPKSLFILYALAGAFIIFLYLTLEYRHKPRIGDGIPPTGARSDYYSDYSGSYLTGDPTELTQDRRSRKSRRSGRSQRGQSEEKSDWKRNALAGAGLFGALKWWQHRRGKGDDERLTEYEDSMVDRRHRPISGTARPGSSLGPSTQGPYRAPSRPPPPAVYNKGRSQSEGARVDRRHDGTVLSPDTWEVDDYEEDEKGYGHAGQKSTWKDRLLGAGAGIVAFQGVKSLWGGNKKRNDEYVDSDVSYRPPHGARQSMISQTDVSRVEAGQAPFSPRDNRRGHQPHASDATPITPTRPPGRRHPSVSSLTYDDDESYSAPPRPVSGEVPSLRDSIATMGAIAGFKEWNRQRKDRNERQRLDRIRQQELAHEEDFTRRNSDRYPRPQDASGRRPSGSGTLMTGPEPATASNPDLSRQSFRPDITQPPLPAAAGAIPMPDPAPYGDNYPNARWQQQEQQQQTFHIPPPPPGPPPVNGGRHAYEPPLPGSLQMPAGAVEPDPSRLVSENVQPSTGFNDGTAVAASEAAAAAAALAASQSPTKRNSRSGSRSRIFGRRGSNTSVGPSAVGAGAHTTSPPISLKMKMHPDGQHVTLRRLNEEEAAAERAARRRERKSRRASSLSSADEGRSRYRRNGRKLRDSSQQPIQNVPPPPTVSNSAAGSHRPPSELNLESSQPPQRPQGPSTPLQGPAGSGLPPPREPTDSGAVGSPGTDVGTGTDVSAFDNNRRRRRAERARRLEASRGNRVEFE